MNRLGCILLGALTMLMAGAGLARVDSFDAQRSSFVKAHKAAQSGKQSEYRKLASQLTNYPLYPYLRYEVLKRDIRTIQQDEVDTFLAQFADVPLARSLRYRWLKELARRKDWQGYLANWYASDDTKLQCYHARARQLTGDDEGLLDEILGLWMVGKSQPDECDPVFEYLYASGRVGAEEVWGRIRLAMHAGKVSLAKYLAKRLPEDDRNWVERWSQAYSRPAQWLDSGKLSGSEPIVAEIVAHSVQRLARNDPSQADERWLKARTQFNFTQAQIDAVEHKIAMTAAYRHHPDALGWLQRLNDSAHDQASRQWQARSALLARDWPALLQAIDALPLEKQSDTEWRYWRARALQSTGKGDEADGELRLLAAKRNYHGFLAADLLQQPYAFTHNAIAHDQSELEALMAARPAIQRTHELYQLKWMPQARREWYYETTALAPREQELATVIAKQWGWHDRAIITAAKAGHLDDLDIRFPVLHQDSVFKMAKKFSLDPSWIFGVMRQESAFSADAVSSAGAVGLMQLMPATGRYTAKLLKIPSPSQSALKQPDKNIQLGTGYLRNVLDRFKGNMVLATAAYNAGPHRVDRWLPDNGELPAEIWIDTIPFTETRGYVRGVLAFATVYDRRLDQPVTPLKVRMPDVERKD